MGPKPVVELSGAWYWIDVPLQKTIWRAGRRRPGASRRCHPQLNENLTLDYLEKGIPWMSQMLENYVSSVVWLQTYLVSVSSMTVPAIAMAAMTLNPSHAETTVSRTPIVVLETKSPIPFTVWRTPNPEPLCNPPIRSAA